jgi:hypothetical protein
METDRKQITISSKFFDLISTKIKNPQIGVSSVDEYVDYVLKELLVANEENYVEESQSEISDEEAEKVKEELKKLGYI